MTLYIRHAQDEPHQQSQHQPAQTICALPLIGQIAISEQQSEKYLGDRRCTVCFPGWTHHKGQTRGH